MICIIAITLKALGHTILLFTNNKGDARSLSIAPVRRLTREKDDASDRIQTCTPFVCKG
jgi:hypothetical protein